MSEEQEIIPPSGESNIELINNIDPMERIKLTIPPFPKEMQGIALTNALHTAPSGVNTEAIKEELDKITPSGESET